MMLNKRDLSLALNISCVESYFLTWLSQYFDVSKLYGIEFLSITNLFEEFSKGTKYEDFNTIKRLQDVSEEYGITQHKFCCCDYEEALKLLEDNKDALCLIKVNSKFFDNSKRKPWRDDHFICINS